MITNIYRIQGRIKEKIWANLLMNMNSKILNKILGKRVQLYLKVLNVITMINGYQELKNDLTLGNS